MNIDKIIEALIFISDAPLRPEQMLEVFQHEDYEGPEIDGPRLQAMLDVLVEKYQAEDYVFELSRIDGGYQFYTKRDYFPYLRHATVLKNKKKLSRASMETLSIIAYRQPITRTEVEFIRGVSCDYAIRKLLDKNLVEITGRSDAPGRPLLYATSSYFMEYFGLNNIKDLPKLEEIAVDEQEFQAQFKVYLDEKEPGKIAETPVESETKEEEE